MPLPSPILADALGLILGFIFLLLFALAGVSSLQRKQEAAHRERIRRELEHLPGAPPTPRRKATPDWPVLREVTLPPSRPTRRQPPAVPRQAPKAKRYGSPGSPNPPPSRAPSSQPPPRPKQRKARQAATTATPPAPPTAVSSQIVAQLVHPPSQHSTREIVDVHQTPRAPAPTTATAPALARWLTPATMRSQFILTEILQKPLALREDQSR